MANKHFIKQLGELWQLKSETDPPTNSKSNRLSFWWKFGTLISFGVLVISVIGWWLIDLPLDSPLSGVTSFTFLNDLVKPPTKPIVYGFLPYWNITKATIQPELTHLAYFGLTVGGDGQIIITQDGNAEPGFHKLQSEEWLSLSQQMRTQKGQVEIVIAQFSADAITSLLGSSVAQEKFLTSLDSILLAYPVSGINIDFEYVGDVSPKLRAEFTDFMKNLKSHLDQKYRHITLSIDVYASAAAQPQLWDISALTQSVDYFIIMAYDFHRRSSPVAGPVAPLFGGTQYWDSDINQYLKSFLSLVSPRQILLGVPFYGYEWQTTSQNAQATTFPDTGATASYERVQTILTNKTKLKATDNWHEMALAPFITYTEDGNNYVLYYENARSLVYKLEYAKQLNLAGIAIWALGYEGKLEPLEQFQKTLNRKPTTS
jgi:spore germination protein YaaH